MQFGREFTDDLSKILALKDELKSEDESIRINAVLGMDTGWMYDFAYIMAQQADPTIRDELHWLDSFEEMNIFSVVLELLPMILAEGKPSPKNV